MTKGNISIYVSVADTARLEELGLDPRVWARDTIKSALKNLEERETEDTVLTDEENQTLEESVGEPSELPALVAPTVEKRLDQNDDWVARLRARAEVEG